MHRREFLKAGAAVSAVAPAAPIERTVAIVSDPSDAVAVAPPAVWAASELESALVAGGTKVVRHQRASQAAGVDLCIVAAGPGKAPAMPAVAEALALGPATIDGRNVLLASGYDARGLSYALLELADRVRQSTGQPLAALAVRAPLAERPANKIRAFSRLFCSDVEDKPWYNDREMWPKFLSLLAAQRFNRFQLSLGIGYDFLREVTDGYFLFPYPFFFAVPGYNVRVPELSDKERDNNLELLKFISEQTVARGIDFQMGLWMHGYEWINSPNPNYTIAGLTRDTHGPYCRDAVRQLLKVCPAISGITFRVHGESGVEEGSYNFWKTVFEGVATCGRKVEIDMHAKGMDQTMIDMALATGQPVIISPKFWGEFMGMSYHQADIRELEHPRPDRGGLMRFSAGSRNFLRYGYGDLMREDRKWGVLHRIWPGTQRLLLWGDPATAAAYSREFSFCDSDGVDIMEPLAFKGRRGSGIAGDRAGYADQSLKPRWDWEKYDYTLRIWGRLLYNPSTDADVWRRYLRKQFGAGANAVEAALGNSSRILPIVTTAHAASAGNNTYWPEVYLNQSLVDATKYGPYSDSPQPRVFGNVSPLDPQLFYRMNDFADDLLAGKRSGKYSPVEVAVWIEDCAAATARQLALAGTMASGKDRPEYRRMAIDVDIAAGLGRFFGAKFRAGVLYRIFEKTGDKAALDECLKQYRAARAAWAALADRGKGVYVADITVGERPQLRGHWLDRLPAIDADIELVASKAADAKAVASPDAARAIKEALARPRRAPVPARHTAPARFQPGQALPLQLSLAGPATAVNLHYRHVNQAERWLSAAMDLRDSAYHSAIPAEYTATAYPLEYYFEVGASLYPGFGVDVLARPYFIVRRA